MKPPLRFAMALGARGLGGVAAATARVVIVGTAVLGFWPLLALIGRRMGTPSRG